MDATGAEGPPRRALRGAAVPFPAQMALTSHLGAVCGDRHGLSLASETEGPAHVHLPRSGLWLSWGQILDHGHLTGMSPSPPPGTAGLGGAAALEPCGDMEHVCALRKRPGGGTGLPCLLRDPRVATGRTDVWELRLERFPSLGSHRPCRDAGGLGGDVAALGGLPSDPQKPRCAYTEREPCGLRAPGGKSSLTGTAMTGWGRGADHTCASSSPWDPGRPQ